MTLGTDGEHRTLGFAYDLLRHAAHERVHEPGSAVSPHDNQIDIVASRVSDDLNERRPGLDLTDYSRSIVEARFLQLLQLLPRSLFPDDNIRRKKTSGFRQYERLYNVKEV